MIAFTERREFRSREESGGGKGDVYIGDAGEIRRIRIYGQLNLVRWGSPVAVCYWSLHKKHSRRRALKSLRRLRKSISDLIDHLEAEDERLSV